MGSVTSKALRPARPTQDQILATGAQIREGRQLLQRGSAWLARRAKVDLRALVEVQGQGGVTPMDPVTIDVTLRAAQRALEFAGVEFNADDGGGVRLQNTEP